ncbi:hypothetical protein DXH95_03100 [Sphingorhabdus pulchriflava]|uniref:Uncharacterized protein n=1 Tax=Sphingorhabdus pulchriflava TaxID=2292257 RepID=A0A371BFY4_9SPHN|nr:hypothetical protein [Sphingorhabdus pulchriflava]RDV06428.1 hypothetical protein DXH95_03100 [Sphingorhabdus pulchriflava]
MKLDLTLDGVRYDFRTPSVYDMPAIRRMLTKARVRRPAEAEFRIAALAGVDAMAEAVSDAAEGQRQKALITDWYELSEPLTEDQIDEPDMELRGEELKRQLAERRARQVEIYPQIAAIEANLERHCAPYAELKADREYFDELSNIEVVRRLLFSAGGMVLARDDDDFVSVDAYQRIAKVHRQALATFAYGLLTPDEARRKN